MKRWIPFLIVAALLVVLPQAFVESPLYARVISISGICLLLWIMEVVPPFVPTLLLWCLVPFFLAPIDASFALPNVLAWAADPVLALFFGGFALGVAAGRSGLDALLADLAIRASGTSYRKFLLIIILITAFFSMWISNIAAAALVFGFLNPIASKFDEDHLLRRTLLIGVALGANIGGIATPIGTGSNAMAIAAISPIQPISFLSWMAFAFPLTMGMLLISYLLLIWRSGKDDGEWAKRLASVFVPKKKSLGSDARHRIAFILILTGTAALWLTEPFHGIPSPIVAIGSAAVLFASRTLAAKDLLQIDWSTLILIAGGITLGRLLEQSALVKSAAANVPFAELPPGVAIFLVCMASAALSAVMSNTATVVMLIPLAQAIIPGPSTAILVAIAASFGMPFVISTPPNAMALGHAGVRFGDLFWPGLIIMVLGCGLVAFTGKQVLNFVGIP